MIFTVFGLFRISALMFSQTLRKSTFFDSENDHKIFCYLLVYEVVGMIFFAL